MGHVFVVDSHMPLLRTISIHRYLLGDAEHAGPEHAGHENERPICRTWNCRTMRNAKFVQLTVDPCRVTVQGAMKKLSHKKWIEVLF